MTATRDLIAAALTLADIDEHVAEMPTTAAADVREMCARAMVQPVSEVPIPEPTTAQHRFRHTQKLMPGWSVWQPCEVQERPTWKIDSVGYEVEYRVLFSPDQMRTYGDAREAAGYAAGVAAGVAVSTNVHIQQEHPMMRAWNAHKATPEYANSKSWAQHAEYVDGSLWALFMAGWMAAEAELRGEVKP